MAVFFSLIPVFFRHSLVYIAFLLFVQCEVYVFFALAKPYQTLVAALADAIDPSVRQQ